MNNTSELSLVHDVLGKLYFLTFPVQTDETFSKDDTIAYLSGITSQMDELLELIKLINLDSTGGVDNATQNTYSTRSS